MRDLAYLKLMSREYPTIKAASSEIINLTAIQGLRVRNIFSVIYMVSMKLLSICYEVPPESSGRRLQRHSATSCRKKRKWNWQT